MLSLVLASGCARNRSGGEIVRFRSRRLLVVTAIVVFVITSLLPSVSGGANNDGQANNTQSSSNQVIDNQGELQNAIRTGREVTVIVQLADQPLATYRGTLRGYGQTRPARGKKLNAKTPNAQAYKQYLGRRRAEFATWLRSVAPGSRIRREYDTVLNGVAVRVSGRELAPLLHGPGVSVVSIDRQFRPEMNVSRALIGTPAIDADLALDGALAGEGMRIGIIDTGIAISHPFFNPAGYSAPMGFPRADSTPNLVCCTSNKVIVARAYPALGGAPSAVPTIAHGSHVAGTAAGNTNNTAEIAGVLVPGMSGLAHRAFLGSYNVFPNFQDTADSAQIISAIEDAVRDEMDVINLSLGGAVTTVETEDLLALAVNNAAEAGVIPAVAAGNSGPDIFTVQSPGNASRALTPGATTNPHFIGQPVSGVRAGTVGGAVGDFDPFPSTTAGWASFLGPDAGCVSLPAIVPPRIAVIARGGCSFTTKIRSAEVANYTGVIVVNNVAGDPTAMAHDGTDPFPTIPAVMIATGPIGASGTATVMGTFTHFTSTNADIIAGFSSRGPVANSDALKPDFTAPGVNVLSATNITSPTPVWAFLSGTSMATPHVAGAAALLKQLHPEWGVQDVKSAMLTLAMRPVFDSATGLTAEGVLSRGGGRINLAAAKDARATFSPASLSYGQPGSEINNLVITLTNVGTSPNSWNITVVPVSGTCVGITLAPSIGATPMVPSGDAVKFTVTASVSAIAPAQACSGDVEVTDGTQKHRLPFLIWHQLPSGP